MLVESADSNTWKLFFYTLEGYMKYSILGFNQEEVIKIPELDLTDLLLLQYIKDAIASPTMQHKTDDTEISYVWLYHEKILEDLPILNIKENMLSKRLKKLCGLDLIKSMQIANDDRRGSKAFYTITEKCECLYMTRPDVKNYKSSDDHIENITSGQVRPDVKNYKSNKLLVKEDNQLNIDNNIKNFELKGVKQTKPNLYSKCMAEINSRNYDDKLRTTLIEYLDLRLQMKDKPLYANSWKGLLNKLEREFSERDRLQVVYQSIERGYASFFPVNKGFNKSNSQLNKPWEKGVSCRKATKEEQEQTDKWLAEQRAKGIKVDF